MSTHPLTDREPPHLHERAVTGDDVYRDGVQADLERQLRVIEQLTDGLRSRLIALEVYAQDNGEAPVAFAAADSRHGIKDWTKDCLGPLASAVEEAGEE